MFFFLQTKNNNVVYVVIKYALNELIYNFKINNTLKFLIDLSTKNYNQFRQIKRKNVEIVITFVVVFNKTRYNVVHKIVNIQIDNKIYFRLHQKYTILNLINYKLFNQKINSFQILKKINRFAFRLQLSLIIKIHLIIFVI